MNYQVEIFDRAGLRVGRYDEVPLLEVQRCGPDAADRIEGLIPTTQDRLGVGYRVRVSLDGAHVAEADVVETRPAWGDARRLILDRYIDFQESLAFVAERDRAALNRSLARSYRNRRVDDLVRDVINSAPGPLHYTVAHTAYPDGAEREFAKFEARRAASDPLEIGGIAVGAWVDAARIDATAAEAKDGDTISGLVVDGVPWPDLRLMMVDCEETSLNSHAIKRHPEVAGWSETRYNHSAYKRRADAAQARLQAWIDLHGIDYIELNPHRDASGAFDDRVDAFGRYIGLVFGGGQCFNAGLVEEGHADVYLYADGRYHVPEMALKEFYAYTGEFEPSIGPCATVIGGLEVRAGALEILTALAALGDGYVFQVDPAGAVTFRSGDEIDEVVTFDPVRNGVELGGDLEGMANLIRIQGDPALGAVDDWHADDESIDAFGARLRFFPFFALSQPADAERLGAGLLRDLAWPARAGRATFHRGLARARPGDLIEFRGGPLAERDPAIGTRWRAPIAGRLVGRVARVTHRIAGRAVETRLDLTSPYRSVANPLGFIIRSQDSLAAFFQFRLDDGAIGLDTGYHLD